MISFASFIIINYIYIFKIRKYKNSTMEYDDTSYLNIFVKKFNW